jgi:hypothetical protein
MNLITLDSIARTYILEREMVWHDYFRVLVLAQTALKEIGKDIDIAVNVKADTITVDGTNKIIVPLDCVQVIGLYVENGDKVHPIAQSDNINPITLKDDLGDPVKRGPQEAGEMAYGYFNDKGEYTGRNFGTPSAQPFQWQQFGKEIRLDVRVTGTCILIIYTTTGLSTTEKNVVHPLAEETIKAFLDWKWTIRGQNKGIWEKRNEDSAFKNEKRLLKGRINGLTWAQYLSTIREFQVATPKY